MNHFLKILDLNKEEIIEILDLSDKLKKEQKNGIEHHLLKGKTLAMIFEKSSTRTRMSFEVGMYQLGGKALFISSKDSQIGRGETIEDTARTMSRYVDAIMIRTYAQDTVEKLAKYGSVPIINGLTDSSHPCQVMADLQTIREYKGKLEGLKLCYIGDGNNMANSLIAGCLKVGMSISIACPENYGPSKEILEFAKLYGDKFQWTTKPKIAAKNADVVVTDVWTSMGQEEEVKSRLKAFEGYQVNNQLMSFTNSECMVLHCLPAHREEEITTEILEKHSKEIFDEAENRLHVQKSILVKLMLS